MQPKFKMIHGRQALAFPTQLARQSNEAWLHGLWGAYSTAEAAAAKPSAHAASLKQSGRHTDAGLRGELRKAALQSAVPAARSAKQAIAVARGEVAKIRAAMVPKDTDNLAALMRRQELRAHFKGLAPAAQAALLTDLGDPAWAAAVAEQPAVVSGVSDALHAKAQTRAALASYPAEAAKIVEIEAIIETVETMVRVLGLEVQSAASISPATLDSLADADPTAVADAASDVDKADALITTRGDRVEQFAERFNLPRTEREARLPGDREGRRQALRGRLEPDPNPDPAAA